MKISIKELIVVHICYRDVFNAPVLIDDLKKWIGVQSSNQESFDKALHELKEEKLVIELDSYLACPAKKEIILNQKRKSDLTHQIIKKGQRGLTLLSKIPFVKFVGISGSIAADNPTNDYKQTQIDLDLFVITAKNTLWIFVTIERIFTNVVRFFRGNHFYCLNYITDESFLEIFNKSFYTATELVNLKPVTDKGVYVNLISCNKWVEKYYHEGCIVNVESTIKENTRFERILAPINWMFFILFGFLRSLKRLDLAGIRELKTSFDPNQRFNMLRASNARGGYQGVVSKRFKQLFRQNFRRYYSKELMEEFFPIRESFVASPISHSDNLIIQLFRKYTLQEDEKSTT